MAEIPNAQVPEPLLTLKDVATKLGLPAFKVTRAAKLGIFPTYTLLNKRKLVRLPEGLDVNLPNAALSRSKPDYDGRKRRYWSPT
jgi:hypothetical protein